MSTTAATAIAGPHVNVAGKIYIVTWHPIGIRTESSTTHSGGDLHAWSSGNSILT